MSSRAPSLAPDLEASLRATLGDALTPGDVAYAVDGLVPAFVATPSSVDELAAVLAAADAAGAAIVPWGGGTHMAMGNAPSRYDLALRTAKLDRVLEYEPADLTVTVEAGVPLGTLQALLAGHGQFLPIDAPAEATAGGVLAAGVSGPSSHAYGLPRDWLLGCRIARADGTRYKGGGRVVKNVAGYDLPKLAVGALGTLGVIVEATFKVAPLPAAQETLLARCLSAEQAVALGFAAAERGLALRAVAIRQLHGEAPAAAAAFWLAGPERAVERTARELAQLAAGANTERLEGAASGAWWAKLEFAPGPFGGVTLRAALLPSQVSAFILHVAKARSGLTLFADVVAYPTTGLVLARVDARDLAALAASVEELRRPVEGADGSLVLLAAPLEVKRRLDVWGDAGTALALMRKLKEQFDPRNTLNPGRYVGGI
ncbi:MAG: FAD-binding oxidoreductase [Chloroflexi bacterium]|nr:FAD-binding oxidoreductase [Chloroflexota bacterium]